MTIFLDKTEKINDNHHVNKAILKYAQLFMDMFLKFKNNAEI